HAVVAEIVHIAVKVDFLDQFETGAVEDSQSALAAGYEKFLCVRGVDNSLWVRNAGYRTGTNAGTDIDDLDGVIAERGHEELVFAVEAEMIESSLNAGSGDSFGENQGTRRFWNGHGLRLEQGKSENQKNFEKRIEKTHSTSGPRRYRKKVDEAKVWW